MANSWCLFRTPFAIWPFQLMKRGTTVCCTVRCQLAAMWNTHSKVRLTIVPLNSNCNQLLNQLKSVSNGQLSISISVTCVKFTPKPTNNLFFFNYKISTRWSCCVVRIPRPHTSNTHLCSIAHKPGDISCYGWQLTNNTMLSQSPNYSENNILSWQRP